MGCGAYAICGAQAAQLNWRNPGIVGRSDLETLLASDDPRNWVAISERLLGPPPPGFRFQPKHKAQVGDAASAWTLCDSHMRHVSAAAPSFMMPQLVSVANMCFCSHMCRPAHARKRTWHWQRMTAPMADAAAAAGRVYAAYVWSAQTACEKHRGSCFEQQIRLL